MTFSYVTYYLLFIQNMLKYATSVKKPIVLEKAIKYFNRCNGIVTKSNTKLIVFLGISGILYFIG